MGKYLEDVERPNSSKQFVESSKKRQDHAKASEAEQYAKWDKKQEDIDIDLVTIKLLNFINIGSIIVTKWETSRCQNKSQIAYKINTGSNVN